MTLGVLVVLLPLLTCAACLFFMCRPRSRCHTDAGQEQGQLREEITALRAQLAAPDRDPVQSQ